MATNDEPCQITGMSGLIDFRDFIVAHHAKGTAALQVVREMIGYMPSLSIGDCNALIRVFVPNYPRASRFVAASHACPSCKSTNVEEMAPHASDASGYSHRCLSCRQMFNPT